MLVIAALLIAIAAGGRSTWSPCGLSMLSSLTPLGERGRGARFETTAAWYLLGAVVGGGMLGALGAMGAIVVGLDHVRGTAVDLAAAAALALAAGADAILAGRRALGHHRQVNERWLDEFRPWVYGSGFGLQIGSGLATYVTTAGVYLVVVLGALSGRPLFALGIGVLFGFVRGAAVYLGRHIESPAGLRSFHARFAALAPSSRKMMVGAELLAATIVVPSAVVRVTAACLLAGAFVLWGWGAAGRLGKRNAARARSTDSLVAATPAGRAGNATPVA